MARSHSSVQRGSRHDTETVRLSVEVTTPTGQQQERISDGLRLVLELLARRYRREHSCTDSRKTPSELS